MKSMTQKEIMRKLKHDLKELNEEFQVLMTLHSAATKQLESDRKELAESNIKLSQLQQTVEAQEDELKITVERADALSEARQRQHTEIAELKGALSKANAELEWLRNQHQVAVTCKNQIYAFLHSMIDLSGNVEERVLTLPENVRPYARCLDFIGNNVVVQKPRW
jgi:chromosome segregation ATPase